MTILEQLAAHAKERVEAAKKKNSLKEIKAAALAMPAGDFAFEAALRKPGVSYSKGIRGGRRRLHFGAHRAGVVFGQRKIS